MNPIVEKLEQYLANLREDGSDSGWMREAIAEIQRLEDRLLEERMKVEAYDIEFKKRCNPLPGKQAANRKRLNDLFRTMGIK